MASPLVWPADYDRHNLLNTVATTPFTLCQYLAAPEEDSTAGAGRALLSSLLS